jgi:hypothetical protein
VLRDRNVGGIVIDSGIAVTGDFLPHRSLQYGAAVARCCDPAAPARNHLCHEPRLVFEKCLQVGLKVDLFNPSKGIGALLVTKAIVIGLESGPPTT